MDVKATKLKKTKERITVCGLGYDSPNPILEVMEPSIDRKYSYPYPTHNYHLRDRRQREIDLVTIENEFLKVSFCSEFGGRIWSALDKKSGEEMFFHNNSFKSYEAGCGGAYIGAGMELNYPQAHSITNCMPRKVDGVENEDGSASVIVSEWERVYRTQWQVSFTLKPGEARLLQKVTFYNRSHLPGRYRYWCNASVPLSDQFRYVYPAKIGSEHGGANIFTWPDYLGLDRSYNKNISEILGLYCLDPRDNYFGYYDDGRKFGIVHHADYHRTPGKKLWTWGQTQIQQNRIAFLSEGLGPYGEIQSGRPINQEHFEFIMPQEIVHWDEVWYPVKGTGYFIQATDQCAVSIEPGPKSTAVIRVFANSCVSGITAQLKIKGRTIATVPVKLKTQQLLEQEIKLGRASAADLVIEFVDSRGCTFEKAGLKGIGKNIYYTSRITLGKTLYDQGKYAEALEELNLVTRFPANFGEGVMLSKAPSDARLNCLKGFCLKKLAENDQAQRCFEEAASEHHKVEFFEPKREDVNKIRFYQALALKELGLEEEADRLIDGVNHYRQLKGLVPLRLKLEDEDLLAAADPAGARLKITEGPEI